MTDLQLMTVPLPSRELDAIICAHFRFFGRERIPEFWLSWKGPIIAKDHRVVLMQDDGHQGPWTSAEAVTSSVDAAMALLKHVMPDVRYLVSTLSGDSSVAMISDGFEMAKPYLGHATNPAHALTRALIEREIKRHEAH